ncbi:MAG: hypothetical protein N2235_24950 [Fischerella sp.]|nr:hypothetical protein [Fischerella sp.]
MRQSIYGLDEYEMLQNLAGYILEQPSIPTPPPQIRAQIYVIFATNSLVESDVNGVFPAQPSLKEGDYKRFQIRPVGRLVPVAAPQPQLNASPTVRTLRPVRSGQAYRIMSPPVRGLVTPELAEALETLFEKFAGDRHFTPENPLEISFSRGFKAGSHGHGEGRAADIVAVGSKSLLEWKQEWDRAIAAAETISDLQQKSEAIAIEQQCNLGYGLYKALQEYGGWHVNPGGWQPYRNVMQLFSPWTATEGPWKPMQIENPSFYQRQRLADQQWVFQAHQDHIHVAR